MRIVWINALVVGVFIVAFDVLSFMFLPDQYAVMFNGYRDDPRPASFEKAHYPKDYFAPHPTRGFDIAPNRTGIHSIRELAYPVWSNSHGCFDYEHKRYKDYVYFAGDSFTWGYTKFEDKFGTIIESKTGTQIVKCGVTHTGQRHQFQKFTEFVDSAKVLPKAVFVFHVFNDPANDFAHPHTDVIDGWKVNNVSLDEGNHLVHIKRRALERKLEKVVDAFNKKTRTTMYRAKSWLKKYSLLVNMVGRANFILNPPPHPPMKDIYELPYEKNGVYWYKDNPFAENNRQAIRDFKAYTADKGIDLVFVLIPDRDNADNPQWYREIRAFLDHQDISYIDLASRLRDKHVSGRDLYWQADVHMNPIGNRFVADTLLETHPGMFERPGISTAKVPGLGPDGFPKDGSVH